MLKLLGKLLGRDLTAPAEPPVREDVSDREILRELNADTGKARELAAFVRLAVAHLKEPEARRLTRQVCDCLADCGSSIDALLSALVIEDGQQRGQWTLIAVDWKAEDEIAWQANELMSTRGVAERWHHDSEANPIGVPAAFERLSDWLGDRAMALLHLDTEGDSYCALILRREELGQAKALAKSAGLTAWDSDEFAQTNNSNHQ